jgi:glycerate 2-kinase
VPSIGWTGPVKVLVAPDKFKGSLTAAEVADAVGRGLLDVRPDLELVKLPVADGGDGTVAAAVGAGYTPIITRAVGPTGQPVEAAYALAGWRAVVELAAVVGLDRLPDGHPEPLGASTFGLGLLIADAVGRGATEIVLGLGGSASTDGGAGMVQALGARLRDAAGADLAPGGAALTNLATLDLAPLRAAVGATRFVVASDVNHPLLGPTGAAAVFGPQKGAKPADIAVLERGLARWAAAVAKATGRDYANEPGAGAAGGAGFAAIALLGAAVRPGIELILELLDFHGRLADADLVITGEGSLDHQSLAGKAPVGVARVAAGRGIPVVAVAGRSALDANDLAGAGLTAAYPLSDLEPDPARSIANASVLLEETGRRIGRERLP